MKRRILTALAVAALAGCALSPLPAPLFAHVTRARQVGDTGLGVRVEPPPAT